MTGKAELKPCPFCGSNNIVPPKEENGWMCRRCGSMGYRNWNSRPMETAMLIRIKKLETENAAFRETLRDIAHGPVGYWNEPQHREAVIRHMMKRAEEILKRPEVKE